MCETGYAYGSSVDEQFFAHIRWGRFNNLVKDVKVAFPWRLSDGAPKGDIGHHRQS